MSIQKARQIIRVLGLFLILAVVLSLSAAKLDPVYERGLNTIRWSSVYDYNRMLASDRFGGRFNADPAFIDMVKWVSAKYKEWGLKPLNSKDGYAQPYPFTYTVVDKADLTLFIPEKKPAPPQAPGAPSPSPAVQEQRPQSAAAPSLKETKLEPAVDFLPYLSTGSGSVDSAELVFAGYGLSAPELGYDDFAGLDVQGKFVLCFSGSPDPENEKFSEAAKNSMKTARQKGVLGFLRISNPIGHPNSDNYVDGFIPAMISEKIADSILDERGLTSAKLRDDLRLYKRPLAFALSTKVRYRVESRHFDKATAFNIVGYLEGADPKLKDEVVLYGAHVDHVGRPMGVLFPGANDNASGSAVVMQIAEAFAKMGRRPKRTVAFGLFSGEEYGILGSQHFAKNLPPQFKKIDVMINFDMVGEGDGARASCSAKPDELKKCIEEAGSIVKILRGEVRISEPKRIGGTDHTAFAVILHCPTASFGSNGPHLAYHLPGDTIFRVNPDIMAEIAKAAYLSGALFADR